MKDANELPINSDDIKKSNIDDSLKSSKEGIIIEKQNSEFLLVSFGGIIHGLGLPIFEFYNSLGNINCDKIFFRDFYQAWYLKGVDSNIDGPQKICNFINHEVSKANYTNITFIGNSMGGYAAILFGGLINVDTVIAFSPQTFIDKKNRFYYFDIRWRSQIKQIYKYLNKNSEYLNLKLFLNTQDYKTKIRIYYSNKHRLDKIHAKFIRDSYNVKLIPISESQHSIVKKLRDIGELQNIIKNSF